MTDQSLSYNLSGQVALVTASARGIGRACALALAHAGADIILGSKDKASGAALAQEIRALGRKALPVQMDVTKMHEINAAVQAGFEHFQHIDILVNNAGISRLSPAQDVTEQDFDAILNINLKGTFFVSQAVGRIMIRQKSGRIINIGSQAGFIALRTESVYCMTKAAISHLTKCLALEWAPYNITVNAVAPTFIETAGTEPALADKDFRQWVLDSIPLGRIGNVSEVAAPVVFLASPAASLITGATLMVDGGWTIH